MKINAKKICGFSLAALFVCATGVALTESNNKAAVTSMYGFGFGDYTIMSTNLNDRELLATLNDNRQGRVSARYGIERENNSVQRHLRYSFATFRYTRSDGARIHMTVDDKESCVNIRKGSLGGLSTHAYMMCLGLENYELSGTYCYDPVVFKGKCVSEPSEGDRRYWDRILSEADYHIHQSFKVIANEALLNDPRHSSENFLRQLLTDKLGQKDLSTLIKDDPDKFLPLNDKSQVQALFFVDPGVPVSVLSLRSNADQLDVVYEHNEGKVAPLAISYYGHINGLSFEYNFAPEGEMTEIGYHVGLEDSSNRVYVRVLKGSQMSEALGLNDDRGEGLSMDGQLTMPNGNLKQFIYKPQQSYPWLNSKGFKELVERKVKNFEAILGDATVNKVESGFYQYVFNLDVIPLSLDVLRDKMAREMKYNIPDHIYKAAESIKKKVDAQRRKDARGSRSIYKMVGQDIG